MNDSYDLAVVGGGAAGLMAAIQAARARAVMRVIVLDGAKMLGAKILIAGGGRCNVTHHAVDASACLDFRRYGPGHHISGSKVFYGWRVFFHES